MNLSTTEIFSAFSALNVMVIGDAILDRYVMGEVTRLAPEAPIPVLNPKQTRVNLGGAANVAYNIKAMDATPYLCSVVGQDKNGEKLHELLQEQGLSNEGIVGSKQRRTTSKTRFLADGHRFLRVDEEDTFDLLPIEITPFLQRVRYLLKEKDIHVIIFQDYDFGVLSPVVIQTILKWAKKLQIPTVADPRQSHFWDYKGVTLFKPNLKETNIALPFNVKPELKSLRKAADFFNQKLNNQYSLITLSEKGMYLNGEGNELMIPARSNAIVDVCGAGDTVISIAALGLALALDIKIISTLANLAGDQVCKKFGVVAIDKDKLFQEMGSTMQTLATS